MNIVKLRDKLSDYAIKFSAAICVFSLATALFFVLIKGIPALDASMLSLKYSRENASLLPALLNTVQIIALSLLICVPLGTAAAVYISVYSDRRFARAVETAADTLTGVPSAVFGLFGMLCFCTALKLGYSLLSGALTLSLMLLPVSLKSAMVGINAVPRELIEASSGLGAGKTALIFKLLLPCAKGSVASGALLSAARAAGETAALIYSAGNASGYALPQSSGRTLAVQLYTLALEGASLEKAYATAAALLVICALFTITANFIKKSNK